MNWAPAGLVIDMDGVLYRGDVALAGLADFIAISARWPRVMLTNNSTLTAGDCAGKLRLLGAPVPADSILTVADAVGGYLAARFAPGTGACVIGERPVREAVLAAGLLPGGHDAEVAIVGLDRGLGYRQLSEAMRVVRAGHPLVATSLDPVLLTADGAVPGAGAIVSALRACTGAEPVCVGKPNPGFFVAAADRLGLPASRLLVIGDSLTSDIAGGQAAGARTALMLTGVTPAPWAGPGRGPAPDYVFASLPELTAFLAGQPAPAASGEGEERQWA